MKRKKTAVLLLCWTHLVSGWCSSSMSPHSVESQSLASVAVQDGYTQFASSLVGARDYSLRFSYHNHYLHRELQAFQLEAALPLRRFPTGVSFHTFGYEHYRSFNVAHSVATRLSPRTHLGLSMHFSTIHYTGMAHRLTSLSLSAALSHTFRNKLLLYGYYLHPLTKRHSAIAPEPLLSVGFTLPVTNARWFCETELCQWRELILKCAFEYNFQSLSIRLGARGLPITPSLGFGYQWGVWQFNIADQWFMHLGHQLSFGINYQIQKKTKP